MKNSNYFGTNETKFRTFSRKATIGVLAIASCLVSSVAQAAPTNNWSVNSIVADCHGTSSYGQPSTSCQSYTDDLYENWKDEEGAGTTDIENLSVGSDDDYFYFEVNLREDWDDEESRQYYLEIEADSTSGYFLVYQPKEDDLRSNWKNMGGSGEVEVYTGSPNSGYNNDLSSGKNLSSGDFYVRLVDGNIQMALKKNKIGSPDIISTRAYASQTSTLEKDKVQWNKHNTISDLDGFGGFDATEWLSLDTTPTPTPTPTPTTTVTAILLAD